jgi:DNA-binding protein H-NS
MSVDERIVAVITDKITAEKQILENRLRHLGSSTSSRDHRSSSPVRKTDRRLYPEVKPKYRGSSNPAVTWSGRGKLPRWLSAQLNSRKKLEDFKID